jgi:hypothetical protein
MSHKNDEAQVQLALLGMQNDPKLSARAAGRIYNVDHEKLSRRRRGMQSGRDIPANSRKLTKLEESVIVQHILDLNSKGYPPRLSGVEDMTNRLLAERDAGRVGTRWAHNFVKRNPELTTRFNRKYDYQRAQCEDPEVIRSWFALVRNTIAKYGIQEADIYTFDETGFQMGVISTAMVVTSSERRGRAKSKQPGYREWATVIQGIKATGWAIPPFIIVKGKHHLSSWYENSPLPNDWVIATSENGWTTNERGLEWIQHFDKHTKARTTGVYRLLVLDGHDSHHSTDFELYCKENNIITLCMPPHSSHILQPLENHQGSSPTHIFDIIDLQAKSISRLAHEMVLLRAETKELRTANERLSKRRRTKKTRLQDGGSLSLQEATILMSDRGLGGRDCEEMSGGGDFITVSEPRVQLCSNCKKPGHNARTCQVVCETSEDSDSE